MTQGEIVACKNCEMRVIPGPADVCPSCGLDVNVRTTLAPTADERVAYYQRDLRNSVWLISFVAFLPTLIYLFSYFLDPLRIKFDGLVVFVLGYSCTLTLLAFVSGVLIWRGNRLGRVLAYIPTLLLLVNFPIGTLFSIFVIRKLNDPTYLSVLK